MVARVVRVLLATEAALDKLGARGISDAEAEQLPRNEHVVVANVRGHPTAGSRQSAGSSSARPTEDAC